MNKVNVPQLRFSGFDGEWEENKTKIQITAGNAYSLKDYQDEGIILIQGLNISPGTLDISTVNYISDKKKSNHVELSEGDILLALNRPVTNGQLKVCRYTLKIKGYLYQRAGKLQFNNDSLISDFFYQYLRSDDFLKDITNELVGSDQPYIRSNLFQVTKIYTPTLPEQQKIASFLSAVDEKIQQLSRKKQLLEQYKKGVMQQLFSGKLRFKDENGKDYPDWEEKKLGEISSLLKDGSHGSHKDVLDSKYYLLSAKNIFNGRISYNDDDRKISEDDFKSIYKNYNLQENDILLTIVGTIGRVAIFKEEKNICFQRSVAFFRFENIYANYMFQLMNGNAFQKELDTRKVVSAQPGIYLGDLAKITVNIPSLPEQQKIAIFLSNIDIKIENTNQEINKMQNFKKGLLQQMFV